MESSNTILSKISEIKSELITRNVLVLIEALVFVIIHLVNTITQEF